MGISPRTVVSRFCKNLVPCCPPLDNIIITQQHRNFKRAKSKKSAQKEKKHMDPATLAKHA